MQPGSVQGHREKTQIEENTQVGSPYLRVVVRSMSFGEIRKFGETLKLLGYPRFVSVEVFFFPFFYVRVHSISIGVYM